MPPSDPSGGVQKEGHVSILNLLVEKRISELRKLMIQSWKRMRQLRKIMIQSWKSE